MKTLINEKCPLRKMAQCDRDCAWRIDAGCSLKVLAVQALEVNRVKDWTGPR
jgi:hypothetical protein